MDGWEDTLKCHGESSPKAVFHACKFTLAATNSPFY